MTIKRIDFLGLPLDTGLSIESVCGLLDQKGGIRLIGYISPSSWADAKKHPGYLDALRQMDVIRAGGQGVSSVCSWLTERKVQRISFDMSSMAGPFFRKAMADKATIMLIGGKPAVDEQMQDKLLLNYKDLKIAGSTHGFGEFAPKIALILEKNPDAVIVGMGTPRQELFILALKEAGYKGYAITCGGFFDQYLEADDYYPKWIDQLNLRFLWRLLKEPGRLWKRYLIDYQLFIWKAGEALGRKYFKILREKAEEAQEKIKEKTKKSG